MFASILDTVGGSLSLEGVILCTLSSIILGLSISFLYMKQGQCSKNFAISLVILPVLIQAVVMMVNGNLGTSVAVLGAFSLVRFRSVPGSSKEICAVFFAMAVGLATGTGFIIFAVILTVVVGGLFLLLSKTTFGEQKEGVKELTVTIPETLDYTEVFDDLFNKYTSEATIKSVKTTNLGSLFTLQYHVVLKDEKKEKEMIDEMRCRNGNLTIICSRAQLAKEQL